MKIKKLIPTRLHTSGQIGIEVEVEGKNLDKDRTGYWKVEHDGSLGGYDNAEYVLSKPIAFNEVERALQELTGHLKGAVLQPSIRTGVHVHINVQEYTPKQVATLSTLYLVVEDLLLEVCGEGRQSNLFCLKGCEAEFMVQQVARFFETGNMEYVGQDAVRYSGLNLAAIPKYGSVEFRSFRTPKDLMEIGKWAGALQHLAEVSKEWSDPIDVINGYSLFDPVAFVKRVLPLYADQLMQVSDWEARLKRGMRSAQDLAFSQDWKECPFSKPKFKPEYAQVDIPEAAMEMRVPKVKLNVDDDHLAAFIKAYPHIDPEKLIRLYNARKEEE